MIKNIMLCCAGTVALALSATAIAQSNGIGRVFFTAQERRALEAQAGKVTPSESVKQGTATRSSELRFNGMVQRSGGRATAWVNGAPLDLLSSEKRRQYRLNGDRLLVNDSFGESQLSVGEQRRTAATKSDHVKNEANSDSYQSGQ
jgi:hypothetical protein